MSISLNTIKAVYQGVDAAHYVGYPDTGSTVPFTCVRPLIINPDELALNGEALVWDDQFTVYCAGGSVEASYNLAVLVIQATHGSRVGGTTLSSSMGYVGAPVEGHYESQVTIQLNQGGI